MQERQDILIGNRVSKRLHAKIVAEQKRLKRETGLEPSLNEVVRRHDSLRTTFSVVLPSSI